MKEFNIIRTLTTEYRYNNVRADDSDTAIGYIGLDYIFPDEEEDTSDSFEVVCERSDETEIGQKFLALAHLERYLPAWHLKKQDTEMVKELGGDPRCWATIPFEPPIEVYYIGYRWLEDGLVKNGNISLVGEPEYREDYFSATERFKAALVVKNERTNPFYVRFEHLEQENDVKGTAD